MRHVNIFSISVMLLLSYAVSPVLAEEEDVEPITRNYEEADLNFVNDFSFGLGIDWGGLGFNYIIIPEDSNIGLSLGLGFLGLGAAASGSVVCRTGDGDYAIFAGAAGGFIVTGLFGAAGGCAFVEFGNLPDENGEFVWRLGVGINDGEIFPVGGFGVSL